MSLDVTNNQILKELYDKTIRDVVNKNNPTLMMLNRKEDFGGEGLRVVPKYGNPESLSPDFSEVQTASLTDSSKFARFDIVGKTYHGQATITGEIISRTRNDQQAYIRAVKNETDSALQALSNRLSGMIFGSGWGDLGVIGTIPGSSTSITLATPSDWVKFEVGQRHVFASTQKASGLRSATVLTVTKVAGGRDTSTITYSAALSSVGAQVGDYIFIKGAREDSATPSAKVIMGFESWLPVSAPTAGDSHFGQDRSVSNRLYGKSMSGVNKTVEEVLIDADSEVSASGGVLTDFVMNPVTRGELIKELGTRTRFDSYKNGNISFDTLVVNGANGSIRILADRNCPANRIFGLEADSWELFSDKNVVRINDDADGLVVLRQSDGDNAQVRLVSRFAQLVCYAPDHNINIQI